MTGVGHYYQERHRGLVQCKKCGGEMVLRSLTGHMQTQHFKEEGGRRRWGATAPSGEPHTYRMAFLTARGPWNFPV